MQLADMFKLAYKALIDRKIRSVLTILGITVGSAIILALIASSSGLSAGITANIEKTGANVLTRRTLLEDSLWAVEVGEVVEGTSTYQLSQLDVNYLKTVPHVAAVYAYYSYSASVGSGGSAVRASVVGIDLSSLPVLYNGLAVAEGNIPLIGDSTSAVVGWAIANPTSGTPINVNQMVSMSISGISGSKGAVSYSVLATAILQEYGTALFANIDDSIFVSLQAAQFLSKTPYFSGIYVVVDDTANVANVQTAITTYYGNNARVTKSRTNTIQHSRDHRTADSVPR